MKKSKKNLSIEDFANSTLGKPQLVFSGQSNQTNIVEQGRLETFKTDLGDFEIMENSMIAVKKSFISEVDQNLSDAEVADIDFNGREVNYRMYFLNGFNDWDGSSGLFYLHLKGSQDSTDIVELSIDRGPGQWYCKVFKDIYIGRIEEIWLAAGTSDGWLPKVLILFYPRGHVEVFNYDMVDTDTRPTLVKYL